MRKYLFNLAGAAALGWGALMMAAPAQAAPVSALDNAVTMDVVAKDSIDTVQYRERRRAAPGYRSDRRAPGYRPDRRAPGYRPGARPGPRCWVENQRVWNGYRHVRRSVLVCR